MSLTCGHCEQPEAFVRSCKTCSASTAPGCLWASFHRQEIQRGELPAETIPQLVDAVRQNLAGAGADLVSVRYLLGLESERPLSTIGQVEKVEAALERLKGHLDEISRKVTLAMNAD